MQTNAFIRKLLAAGQLDPERAQRIATLPDDIEQREPTAAPADEPAPVGVVLAEAQAVSRQSGPQPLIPPPAPEALSEAMRRAVAMLARHAPELRVVESRGAEGGQRPGPGAFVALLIAIAWLYRAHERQTIVDVFAVQQALADALGVSERTIRRWQARADVARWIGARPWYGTIAGERRRGGMIYSVRIRRRRVQRTPRPVRGISAIPWRDLEADISEGNTYAANRPAALGGFFDRIKEGTLIAWSWIIPVNPDTLSAITHHRSVSSIRTKNRAAWVRRFAAALARALKDGASRQFWLKIGWGIVRENAYDGNSAIAAALIAAWREVAGSWERLKSPAAVIVAALNRRLLAAVGADVTARLAELDGRRVGAPA